MTWIDILLLIVDILLLIMSVVGWVVLMWIANQTESWLVLQKCRDREVDSP